MELSGDQIQEYNKNGFLTVTGVFSRPESSELEKEAERLFAREELIDSDNIRCRWQNHFETGECRFDCFDPVIDLSPLCGKFARDSRLIDIVSQIYGERAC